jgi:hypothetical protein
VFLVDSSGWIEFLTDGPLAQKYEKYLKDPSKLKTPTIVIYEVYKEHSSGFFVDIYSV